jgi:uncharacterized protein
MRRVIFKILRAAVIVYAALCVILYFAQDWMLFPGAVFQGTPAANVSPLPGCELVHLTNKTGDRITAMFGSPLLPNGKPDPDASPRPTLLYFYGNGAAVAWSLGEFQEFRRLGANVLMPDFAGYGMSSGKPSEANCYATADAAYDYLVSNRHVDPRMIVAVGWSLGSAVAIDLADRRPVGGLAVFNAFTSLRAMAHHVVPWMPTSVLLKYRFDNLDKIRRIDCPLFICNGLRDEIVPPVMSDILAAAARGRVTRVRIATADHNGIFTAERQNLFPALGEFIDKVASTGKP